MDSHQSVDSFATTTSDTSVKSVADIVDGVHKLAIEEEDDYQVHEDELVTLGEVNLYISDDSGALEDLENAFGYHVDIATQELQHAHRPVYTRALLERVKYWTDQIRQEFPLASNQRLLDHVDSYGLNKEKCRIWNRNGNTNANTTQVEYLSRVEMHPDFQSRYGNHSEQIKALRCYNKDRAQDCIDTPYTFITLDRCFLNERKDTAKMTIAAPIKKIVYFGLGRVSPAYMYDSLFQNMAVLSMALDLVKHYEAAGIKQEKIQIVLQGPWYEETDWTLFRELHQTMGCKTSTDLDFVQDPDGLLVIDSSTMVVAPHLPKMFPWSQIIADLFASGSGLAVIIGDCPVTERRQFGKKTTFTFLDRGSPTVARFLSDRYVVFQKGLWNGGDGTLLALGMDEHSPFSID
ncbi:hypothetical protein BKA58DRAFT_438011 [Alternaria rosae]|uniref:uncharacterized protein n=1 Tax=Alternaria rosae TaxID=1187941 RepID=UPI001E8D5A15|nr:uncharacterized protein BKA58DRAFT_438011 [Alternaria rosae]KAH6876059.1 hypothetical protein BKA58DRAFT_438011 [Alternaria rosae]